MTQTKLRSPSSRGSHKRCARDVTAFINDRLAFLWRKCSQAYIPTKLFTIFGIGSFWVFGVAAQAASEDVLLEKKGEPVRVRLKGTAQTGYDVQFECRAGKEWQSGAAFLPGQAWNIYGGTRLADFAPEEFLLGPGTLPKAPLR